MFHDSVCLKDNKDNLIRVIVSECNDFEDCDVTSMTSWSHVTSSMTSPIDVPWALSYRVPIGHERLNRLVFEIFSIEVADTHRQTTDRQTQTHRLIIRVAERLKLSSRASSLSWCQPVVNILVLL